MAQDTTPWYDPNVQDVLIEYQDQDPDKIAQGFDDVGAFASSTYGRHAQETVRDLSAATSNEAFRVTLPIRPSAHHQLSHMHPMDENGPGRTGFGSTLGFDWHASRSLHPAALDQPQFNLDPATLGSTWCGDPQIMGNGHLQLPNSGSSLGVSNGAYSWQNSTQQADHEPWNPLNVNYGTVPLDGTADYRSNTSTMEHHSSGGRLSSWSYTGATTASRTSEGYEYVGKADRNLTEHQSWYQPGRSPAIGDNAPSPMAQPGSLHVVTGVHSRSSSIQPHAHDGGDPSILSPQEIAPNTVGDRPHSASLECEVPGCSHRFSGTHRRGTMHRHMRLKHGGHVTGPEKTFPCEVAGCRKTFKRQDARLKHHRRRHPELGIAAATPRKDRRSS